MRNERSILSERSESNGPDPLDALIDSAARQVVAGEPSSLLRSRVRDRIEHRRSPWLLAPAIAGAAATAVIAAVLVGRALSDAPGGPDKIRPAIQQPAIAAVPEPQPQVAVEVEPVRDLPAVRLARRLAEEVATVPQEEEPMIPPIAIEPLVTVQTAVGNPIAVESSRVVPIEIEPLQIEPLQNFELPIPNSQLPKAPET